MVRNDASIADAMRSLNNARTQIVLVVDRDDRLEGTLTDGDLRRAILAGETLDSPVAPHVNRRCASVAESAQRAEVLDLMQARLIHQVPVLDADRRVVGLHLLHEMLAAAGRPNPVVVMAGGKGTRLAPLTEVIPKPMLPIAGRPILERLVLQFVGTGLSHVYLAVNYMADVIERHFGDGARFGCTIEYLRETEPLGTAGALSLLPEKPQVPLLVTNGDIVTGASFGAILDFHDRDDHQITMAVRRHVHRIPFGCVEVRGNELVGLREKPMTEHLINAGIYVLDPDILDLLEPNSPASLPELVQRATSAGVTTRVIEITDDWADVGERASLDRARRG